MASGGGQQIELEDVQGVEWLAVVDELMADPANVSMFDELRMGKGELSGLGFDEEVAADVHEQEKKWREEGRIVDLSMDDSRDLTKLGFAKGKRGVKRQMIPYEALLSQVGQIAGKELSPVHEHQGYSYQFLAMAGDVMDASKLLILGRELGDVNGWFLLIDSSKGQRMMRMMDSVRRDDGRFPSVDYLRVLEVRGDAYKRGVKLRPIDAAEVAQVGD